MTEASESGAVDYVRAIEEARAYLARRDRQAGSRAPGRGGVWAAMPSDGDLRYPMPALDPARR
ncbi:hypothetical protein [Hansschlegelia zhihuaiae]|uniref:Uncharacterized protein n=1 Tax=Hansschlegelia zhihuaiae TaxID=405005 RepID=A0A4V1KJU0_9HYPH|nr:hypothetical protein [Hansschlegelia zhihuaiae]RXF75362.1 hypothetical protein EK403_00395 [Hansschlegelia zhihuaiae]